MRFSFLNDEIKSMKYYGSGDLAGGIFVKNVIDSLKTIEDNLTEINSDIVEIEDLYRYLWILSFKEMVVEIDCYNIEEPIKEKIKQLSQYIDFSPARFIRYINENYESALNKESVTEVRWYEFYDMLMNLIYGKYSSGIVDEVFEYIENRYALNILSHFEVYSKYYKDHKSKIHKLFSGLKSTRIFDDSIYCGFLMSNNLKSDPFFNEQARFICERSLIHIKSMNLSSESKDILQIQSQFLEYRKLAILYELVCANDFNSYKKELDALVNEYLMKHGQSINIGPIDFKPAIDLLKSSDNVWRFLQLTHTNKNGVIENNLNRIFLEKTNDSLSEFVGRIGEPRSEKYPYYKQDAMNMNLWVNCNIVSCIFNDEELCSDFANYVYNLSNEVEVKFFRGAIELKEEMAGTFELIANIIGLIKNTQTEAPLYKALTNGCVLNECGLFEKILRNIALIDDKDVCFFDPDSNTIGSLFKNHKFTKLSEGLNYYLEFYLSRETNERIKKEERPGKDIRNIQMHNHDEKYKRTDLNLCLELFYLALSLLGDLLVNGKRVGD